MKRILFSIFSILQFASLTSSCRKCVTCTLYYYSQTYAVNPSKYCGSEKQINAFEAGVKSSLPFYAPDSGLVTCAETK